MKTKRIQWQNRTVEISHDPGRYFCKVLFFNKDTSGMGVWTIPSDDEKSAIVLAAGPKLSRSRAWRNTFDYYYERRAR